jgi:microcin C transport system permease protein
MRDAYVVVRLLLIIPTLFGIMLVTFILVQFAPGGPIDHVLSKMHALKPGFGLDRSSDPNN